jgi:hypothetical protein
MRPRTLAYAISNVMNPWDETAVPSLSGADRADMPFGWWPLCRPPRVRASRTLPAVKRQRSLRFSRDTPVIAEQSPARRQLPRRWPRVAGQAQGGSDPLFDLPAAAGDAGVAPPLPNLGVARAGSTSQRHRDRVPVSITSRTPPMTKELPCP